MKTEIDDGGFAFSCPADDKSGWRAEYGMTLRDWFAGNALVAMGSEAIIVLGPVATATTAYDLANAMIAARKGGA